MHSSNNSLERTVMEDDLRKKGCGHSVGNCSIVLAIQCRPW